MSELSYDDLEGSNVRPTPPEDEEPGTGEPVGEEPPLEEDIEAAPALPAGLSRQGAAFISRFEGFRAHLYNDPVGHCTIGFGHLVHHGPCNGSEPQEFKRGITRDRALQLLQQDVGPVVAEMRRRVRVSLTQTRFDALCSWGFNCGAGVFLSSTLVRKLNAGDHASVSGQLARWDKAGNPLRPLAGLTRRRRAEGKLYTEGKYE